MSFERQIELTNLRILEGHIDEAERSLAELNPETPAQHRTLGHYKGIIAFNRGQISEAKRQFELTQCMHGDNVNLLRDLVVCQYHLQEMASVRANLELLHACSPCSRNSHSAPVSNAS